MKTHLFIYGCWLIAALSAGGNKNNDNEIKPAPSNPVEKKSVLLNHVDDWAFYLTELDNNPTSVLIDLGLKDILPVEDLNFLAFINFNLIQSGDNGLGTKDEFKKLQEIESALELSLTASNQSVYAGRTTRAGQREFYYYTKDTVSFENIALNSVKEFDKYNFRIGFKEDNQWAIYQELLYPKPEDMQRIQNSRGIENLANNGDALKSKRNISHWIYFKTETGRNEFEKEVLKLGYNTEETYVDENDEIFPFTIEISRYDLVNYESIDSLVLPLFRLAKKYDGDYDGWETNIQKN